MTKALIIADLHLDFWRSRKKDPLEGMDLSSIDLLLLAGDISNKGHVQWKYALEWLSERIDLDKVHIGPGNHDYYGGRVDREDKLRDVAEAAGANFMQKSTIVLGDKRFLYCTLWTDMRLGGDDFQSNIAKAERIMNDHRNIRIESQGYRKMGALHSAKIHMEHKSWLDEALSEPFDGDTIVVTHHAPHPRSVDFGMKGALPFAYGSDLTDMILTHQPKAWYHGHTHYPADYHVGDTMISNVSIGYPPEIDPERAVGHPERGVVLCADDSLAPGI